MWAVEACEAAGCKRFAVNTHHLPEKWKGFGEGRDVSFFHEPVLLETGGGLKNIESWVEHGSLLIHNGDIFSSMDLGKLVEAHESSGDEVTLALRSEGGGKKISLGKQGRVEDVRSEVKGLPGTHVFTGIYCVRKEFLKRIPAGEVIAVIPAFQQLVRESGIGGVVLDEGEWMDLGRCGELSGGPSEARVAGAGASGGGDRCRGGGRAQCDRTRSKNRRRSQRG